MSRRRTTAGRAFTWTLRIGFAIAVGGLVLAGCNSDETLGRGQLVLDADRVQLCEAVDVDGDVATCVGPTLELSSFTMIDVNAVQLGELGDVQYSENDVELVRLDADPAFVLLEARPISNG